MERNKRENLFLTLTLAAIISTSLFVYQTHAANSPATQETQPISSRLAFLRAQRAAAASRLAQAQQAPKNDTAKASTEAPAQRGTATALVNATEASKPAIAVAAAIERPAQQQPPKASPVASQQPQQQANSQNRTTRTADVFQGGEGFNIFVTNTCERELMHVNIKTSRPFYGVIHTRNQRQKTACTTEGTGDTEFNLDISHVLNQQDPNYCGVIRARKESPDDNDLLSVVLAVRVHRNIELSDDKFFLLNCTNRCRRPDCTPPSLARLTDDSPRANNDDLTSVEREGDSLEGSSRGGPRGTNKAPEEDECTVWKFPWLITLLWCMGILLLAMIISHCIMCSSLVCRCVKTDVEEREPSVYEGATDDEDSLYNRKTHPMRIDYDNRDIYKTSNNYEPYSLNNDDNCDDDKTRHNSSANKRRNRSGR